MPLYHIAFCVLIVGMIVEFVKKETPKKLYFATFLLLTVMLCLRYGQGTDYLSYGHIYNMLPMNILDAIQNENIHGEPGWKVICIFFRLLRLPFPVFVFVISAAEMALLWRFISRYCRNRCMALLLCYHTLYLTYFFGALRQGIVIAVFLGLLLGWAMEKKYIPYVIGCLLCAAIHSSALILLILPILRLKLFDKLKWQFLLVGVCWAVGLISFSGVLDALLLPILPSAVAFYYSAQSISVFAVLKRIVTYVAAAAVYWLSASNKRGAPKYLDWCMRMVTIGMALYGGLCWMPLVASRTAYFFEVAEIVLFSSALLTRENYRRAVAAFCAVLSVVMYVKNIESYIDQGMYFDDVNFVNYPYISVFDRDAILDYRSSPYEELP